MLKNLRKQENLHILLWLLKDTCWVLGWQVAGVVMIVPTLVFAFFITWHTWRYPAERMHNLAVCCWIMANSIWMIGEFFYDDTTRPFALFFFCLGLLNIVIYYVVYAGRKHASLEMIPGEGKAETLMRKEPALQAEPALEVQPAVQEIASGKDPSRG